MNVYIVKNMGCDDIMRIVGVFATRYAAEVFVGQQILLEGASGGFFIVEYAVEEEK